MWDYERKEPKKRYKIYLHYDLEGYPDKYVEPLGEIWAYSPEQAAHLMSLDHGDGGSRIVAYKGYSCRYIAEEC